MLRSPRFPWAATIGLVTLAVGCGDGRPTRVPVSGKVLIDGQPLTYGAVRFNPTEGRVATGAIGPDGTFTLGTYELGDGVAVGTHAVTILAAEELEGSAIRWHVPKKYQQASTSELTQTIDGPTDAVVIELTWDGQKGPFVEKIAVSE